MSDFGEFSLPANISEGAKEAFAFFHHQISQLSKDVASLNKRVAELSKDRDTQPVSSLIADLSSSLTQKQQQHEAQVKETLENLSTDIRTEFTDKLLDIGIKVNEIRHRSDTVKTITATLEPRVTELVDKSRTTEMELLQIRNELAELKKQPPLAPIEPAKTYSRPVSPRRSLNRYSRLEHIEIFTSEASPEALLRLGDSQNLLRELKSAQKLFNEVNDHSEKLTAVMEKLDEYATKSDLYAIVQGFIASGADGVAESASHLNLTRPGQTKQLIIDPGALRPPVTRQRASFKRPFTTHISK